MLKNPLLASGFEGSIDLEGLQDIMSPEYSDQNGDGILYNLFFHVAHKVDA